MKRLLSILAAPVLLLCGVNQAHGSPISSTLSLQADASASPGPGLVTDTDSQSQGATINPLSASVLAQAINGNASVTATATGSATWTNPNIGQVVLSNIGWATSNVSVGAAFLHQGLDYSYTFTADATGTFTFNYNVTWSGTDDFGLNGFNYDFSGNSAFLNLGTSGTILESVIAGNTYTLTLRNQANISGGLGTRTAHMTGTFDFTAPAAAEIPEPGTWAVFGLMGFVGLVWMQRKVIAAA